MTNWKSILYKLSENIQSKVLSSIPQRGQLSNKQFKDLLDNQAQDAIIETLTCYKVSARLISEEGDVVFGDGDYIITADPVDGTTNLSRGLQPAVLSISVATEPYQNSTIAGIITNFYTGEIYYAEKDRGATLDDNPIHVAQHINYSNGLIGMDLSKDPKLDIMGTLVQKSRHIRQEGCSAASLCHVASGVLDAHIDFRGIVRATDISAGLLIIRESGGVYKINDELFGDMPLTKKSRVKLVAASTIELLEEIQQLMEQK